MGFYIEEKKKTKRKPSQRTPHNRTRRYGGSGNIPKLAVKGKKSRKRK